MESKGLVSRDEAKMRLDEFCRALTKDSKSTFTVAEGEDFGIIVGPKELIQTLNLLHSWSTTSA
jgi:hypothetical protein